MAPLPTLEARERAGHLETKTLPARYRARVLTAFPGQVERIVLFGSRARRCASR